MIHTNHPGFYCWSFAHRMEYNMFFRYQCKYSFSPLTIIYQKRSKRCDCFMPPPVGKKWDNTALTECKFCLSIFQIDNHKIAFSIKQSLSLNHRVCSVRINRRFQDLIFKGKFDGDKFLCCYHLWNGYRLHIKWKRLAIKKKVCNVVLFALVRLSHLM